MPPSAPAEICNPPRKEGNVEQRAQRRLKGSRLAIATVVALVGAAAFGGALTTRANAKPSKMAAPIVIGYSDPLAAEEGLRSVGYGARQAIKQLHLNWQLKELDAKLSANQQVSDVDTFVSLKAQGIMSWTLDPGAAEAAYQRARAAGAYVIGLNSTSKTFNSEIAAHTDTTCIVSNQQAAYIAKLAPKAKILAIGGPPVPSITLTTKCFLEAAKKAGLTVLESQNDTQGSQQGGQKVAQNLLTKHPDVQAIWVFSESSALGAVAALRSAGKTIWSGSTKGVVVVSRNGTSAAAAAIKSGNLTATWDNNQPQLGAAAIQVLKMLIVDKVSPSKVPKLVPVPSKRWDLGNISQYKSPLTRAVSLAKIGK
jgi:ribose transport system substrate-binding protein